jgi:nucleotide-binding universal stress UspA family protein
MTYLVPFDGTDLSEAALAKAHLHAQALDEVSPAISKELVHERPVEIVAVSVIPNNPRYARDSGWIQDKDEFEVRDVANMLHKQVTEIAPDAQFNWEHVGKRARAGIISNEIRSYAEDTNTDIVFIGSENAGRVVSTVSSVGRQVATETDFDVCIVRHPYSPEVMERLKSDFFV